MDDGKDLLAGFGEGSRSEEVVEVDAPTMLAWLRDDGNLRHATVSIYLAFSAPLLAIAVVVLLRLDLLPNPWITATMGGVLMAVAAVLPRMDLDSSIPGRVGRSPELDAAHDRHRRISLISLVGTGVTFGLMVASGAALYFHELEMVPDPAYLLLATVVFAVASFLIPALLGFSALAELFQETERFLEESE